jgi:hypothetical protein
VFIKAVTLHSLPYIVGVTSSLVAGQYVVSSPSTAFAFWSGASNKTEIFSTQAVNRSLKSSRLPIKQAAPEAQVKELVKAPKILAPNPKLETNCRPYIDVPGRCFAGAKPDHEIALIFV